jgi:hypothetical protein
VCVCAFFQAHLNGKKYKKMKAAQKAEEYNFKQHEPHIVPNKRDPRKLFCHRTKLHLNRVPEEVEVHVKGRRFRARLKEWEEKQQRRAEKAARKQAKADDKAAYAAKRQAAGSDDEEDPVLAKFAFLQADESEDDEEEENGSSGEDQVPYSDSDADGDEEMTEARSSKEHYNKGRLEAQARARENQKHNQPQAAADDEGSDFEVVAGEQSESEGDNNDQANGMEGDESDSEPEHGAAKKLSIARHAARKEREAAGGKQQAKLAPRHQIDRSVPGEHQEDSIPTHSSSDALWRHGAVVTDKHHGRSRDGDKHHGRSKKRGGAQQHQSNHQGKVPINKLGGVAGISKKNKAWGARGGGSMGRGARGGGGARPHGR